MHTGKSYRLPEFLYWTRRTIYVLVVVSVVPVALYQLAGWTWLVIPWGVVFLLGALTFALQVVLGLLSGKPAVSEPQLQARPARG